MLKRIGLQLGFRTAPKLWFMPINVEDAVKPDARSLVTLEESERKQLRSDVGCCLFYVVIAIGALVLLMSVF